MIKSLSKPKKKQSLSTLRKKCDKAMQEIGRQIHPICMVCGKPISCHHHFYPKSMSSNLRYDWENLIPLCTYCHFSHHNGNPEIHESVIRQKGDKWLNDLKSKRLKLVKPSKKYYQNVLETLNKII